MMDRRRCHGSRADVAVRGQHLLHRTERVAAELTRDGVGAVKIGIDHARQANRFALLFELLVDAGVVASKDAHPHYRDGNRFVSLQEGTPNWPQQIVNGMLADGLSNFDIWQCKSFLKERLLKLPELPDYKLLNQLSAFFKMAICPA
jgi:hypothetical protein